MGYERCSSHVRGNRFTPIALIFFFGMPFLASLGSVVTVAELAVARPWAVATLVVVLFARPQLNRTAVWVLTLAVLWTLSGLLTIHTPKVVRSFLGLPVSLMGLVAVTLFPWSLNRLRWLGRGWLAAWGCSVAPAVVELVTGTHLPNYLASSPVWIRESSDDIASYFVNPNPFAFFLCTAMIALATVSSLERSGLRRVMLACAGITPVLIYFTNSRIIFVVSLVVLIWMFFSKVSLGDYARNVAAAFVVLGVVSAVFLLTNSTFTSALLSSFESSGSSRLGLYLNGIWMYFNSAGLGVGPGMFEELMRSGAPPFQTNGAVNPHSGVFEILSQYSFVVSAFIGAALIAMVLRGLHLHRRSYSDARAKPLLQGVIVAAVTLPALSFGDSRFIDSPIAWAHVSTMLALWATFSATMKPLPAWSRNRSPKIPARFHIARRRFNALSFTEPSR